MAIAMPKTVPARKPPAGHYDPCCEELAARISGGNAGDGSADPKPKIAKVERREARVPPLRDARRLASAWPAASCAGRTGADAPVRLSALRPPLDRGGTKIMTRAPTRRGNGMCCSRLAV